MNPHFPLRDCREIPGNLLGDDDSGSGSSSSGGDDSGSSSSGDDTKTSTTTTGTTTVETTTIATTEEPTTDTATPTVGSYDDDEGSGSGSDDANETTKIVKSCMLRCNDLLAVETEYDLCVAECTYIKPEWLDQITQSKKMAELAVGQCVAPCKVSVVVFRIN